MTSPFDLSTTAGRAGRGAAGLAARLLPLVVLLAAAAPAAGQGFRDYEYVGRLEDARHEPSPIRIGPHHFEPTSNIKLFGILTPHVFGAATAGYTDNVLLSDREAPGVPRVAAGYGRLTAGTRLDMEVYDHRFELEYRGVVTEYVDTGRFDTLQHTATLRADLFWTDLEAHGDVGWTRTSYPQSIQLTGIVELEQVFADVWGELRIGRFGVRAGVGGRRLDYLQGELEDLDHRVLTGQLQAYGRLFPKLRGLVEYGVQVVRYDEGRRGTLNDYLLHQVRVGIDGELTPKLTASLKVGYALQDVERSQAGRTREYQGYTAELSASWQVLPATALIGLYRREITVSTRSDYLLSDSAEARVKQSLLQERIDVQVFAGYTHSTVSPGEHLNRFRSGASAQWRISDWVSLAGSYEFVHLTSAFPGGDYDAHVVELSLGFGL